MSRRIDVAVKDKCYALLFRMDELKRKLDKSQADILKIPKPLTLNSNAPAHLPYKP
jgi:hypothetical protein